MAPNAHIKKAITAMKALGIEEAQIKPVLKNLLTLYDKKWDLIAEDNYRALADAIFEAQETQAVEEKKGKEKKANDEAEGSAAEVDRGKRKAHETVEDDEDALDEPERPLKRLRRRGGEVVSASASNSPSLGSPCLNETTTHDPVSLPFHPIPTENDPDAGALVIPKGEPSTDSLENGNSSAPMPEAEETNGRVEEPHGSTAATDDGATTTIERASEHTVATTPEGISALELASSATGEVKINLSFAPATGGSSLHAPSMDELRRAMEDVCLRQYKILDPNFSVSRFLNDIASSYLELATKAEQPANQSPENLPSLTTNVDVLKKSAAAMAFTAEGRNDLAAKVMNSANQSPESLQTTKVVDVLSKSAAATTANTSKDRNGHVRDDENSGAGESMGLVVVPECHISADELRMISSVSDITFGKETVEIPWVNEVNTKVPSPFRYMTQSLVYLDAEVKFSLGNIKDQCCSSCCGDCLSPAMACSCATAIGGFAYTKDGLLQKDFLEECISEARNPQKQVVQYCKECPLEIAKNEETLEPCKGHLKRKAIRECWISCGCTKKCGNQVVQHGLHTKLQVFFTSNGRGWGLRTLEKLPKGAFVCELAGEILTISELVQPEGKLQADDYANRCSWKMGLISGILFGIIFGVALMAGWSRMMSHRSSKRVAKAVDMKLLGSLSREDLMKICGDNFPQWISFPAFEQVKWLNKLLGKMWPFIAEAATMVIRDSVEPLLEDYRPPGITSLKFSKLTLGNVAPKIEGIRVQSFKEGQITMDVDLRWGGDPNIVLGVTALVASIPIQLKDLQVFTVARVIFQLADEIPCISAVVVALLAEPKPRIDYTLKAVGGSLTAIPGLSDMIDDTVDSIVKDMLQWPHRIVVPIGGIPVDISELELKPQGKLIVTVVKATNLKNKELIGKSDPYATIHIRPVFKYKTKAIENNLNPVWDQTFELIAEDKETQSLTVEVFDKDVGQDERLGLVKLPLSSLEAGVTKEMELNLLSSLDTLKVKDKKDRGSITLKVHYHEFNKEEQMAALEEEKKIMEERKRLKDAGMIGSTMDAVGSGLGAGVGMVGTGIGAGVGLVGTGVSSGVGMVGSGFGAVGSGLSKAGRFMGRTITGQTSKRSGSSTPVNSETDGSKQQ